jgi:hypothetical protein
MTTSSNELYSFLMGKMDKEIVETLTSYIDHRSQKTLTDALTHLATKADLANLRAELKIDKSDLKAELKTDAANLRTEQQTVKSDMLRWLFVSQTPWYVTILRNMLSNP